MQVGTVAAARIGLRALRLLKPFDVKLHYLDRHRLPEFLGDWGARARPATLGLGSGRRLFHRSRVN
jgi:lactate dehydrogenase-like 2-hydroxyacid dehydrogenase